MRALDVARGMYPAYHVGGELNTMFERLTDRARKVMALANQEAQRFNHEYIGTEHILLGLVKEGSGVGANVLKHLEIDLRKVSGQFESLGAACEELNAGCSGTYLLLAC